MAEESVRVIAHEYGDSGMLFDVLGDTYEQRWATTQAIGAALRREPPPGFEDVVASYQNVFVAFDPRRTSHQAITAAVVELASQVPPPAEPRIFEVAVVYGGDAGPDLPAVAEICGVTPDEVVRVHSGTPWVVRFVGSPIGAPLMDGSQFATSIPRLATPRARVNPGSVAVSGAQCVIYNAPSPGGWQVLGRTPNILFDLATPPHVRYRPGDLLRFVPIPLDDWATWQVPPRLVST